MGTRRLFIGALAFFVVLAGFGRSVNGQYNSATVLPSSISDGTVASRRPTGVYGNLIITGNVGAGRHFQGVVPYGATTDFGATLGSSSLDSFLRRSGGLEKSGSYTWTAPPFYSPSRTVTTTSPGQSGVVGPQIVPFGSRTLGSAGSEQTARDSYVSGALQHGQEPELYGSYGWTATGGQAVHANVMTQSNRLPGTVMPVDPVEQVRYMGLSERLLRLEASRRQVRERSDSQDAARSAAESGGYAEGLNSLPMEVSGQAEPAQLRDGFLSGRQLQAQTELRSAQGLMDQGEVVQPGQATVQRVDTSRRSEPALRDTLRPDRRADRAVEVRERAQPHEAVESHFEAYEPARTRTDAVEAKGPGGEVVAEQPGTSLTGVGQMPTLAGTREDALSTEVYAGLSQDAGFPEGPGGQSLEGGALLTIPAGATPLRDRARAIMGPHATFESFTRAKFAESAATGADYLTRGMYYRAADSYAMASIYTPDDASAYAGRSHALFAAGEYMSSALYIARAVEILAGVDSAKQGIWVAADAKSAAEDKETKAVDVTTFTSNLMIVDRDKLESRLVDIEAWQKKTDSGKLLFLAAYVCHQIGRDGQAKTLIEEAGRKMPGTRAVEILKRTIEASAKTKP